MSGHQRIFLGHASEDKPQVRDLYDQLKSRGFSPWLDVVDLIPGQNWRDEIPNAIIGAGIFLACLSKRSAEKQGYVQREFRSALSAYAERPPNSIYLVPVRLEECEIPDLRLPELGLNLRDLHWVDLFEKDGFERLLQALKTGLGSAPTKPKISGGDDRLSLVIASFEALFAASEKASTGNQNPAARRIRDSLADCLEDLRCCGGDIRILATFPSYLASLAKDIDGHLLGRYFEVMPTAEVLKKLEALTVVAGVAGKHRVDTLDHEELVAALKAAIGQALDELPAAGLEHDITKIADRELRHLRREVGKPSFDAAVVGERRKRLEDLKVDLLERTTLLTETLLAGGFPSLPTGTVFRHLPEIWCPQLVMIPSGTFLMGSPKDEVGRRDDEDPQRKVRIRKGFGLGRYAVTFDEYNHFCEATGRYKKTGDGEDLGRQPVTSVSYGDAVAYCSWLSKSTDARVKLPSEAMWEYACRAGTITPYSFEAKINIDLVNYFGDYPNDVDSSVGFRGKPVPVGSFPGNAWGLHEMHGNVGEWCASWLVKGPRAVAKRVARGGSWGSEAWEVRSAHRDGAGLNVWSSNIGFRCAGVQSS